MALEPIKCFSRVFKGQWITTLARVVSTEGVVLQISSLSAVEVRVFRSSGSDDDDRVLYSKTDIAPSDVMFDALQVGGAWDQDAAGGAGYCFRHQLKIGDANTPGMSQCVLDGGERYVIEYRLISFADGPVPVVHVVDIWPLLSS